MNGQTIGLETERFVDDLLMQVIAFFQEMIRTDDQDLQ
jgi:hypothetical protein